MNTTESLSINDLIFRAANGDSAACNVLDMIDANESDARNADGEQLARWYDACVQAENDRAAEATRVKQHDEYMRRVSEQRARDRALLAPVITLVRAAGVTIDDDGDVEGAPEADLRVEMETMRVSSWRSRKTGRSLIVVGQSYLGPNRESPVRFPPRKDGTYNVEKIAARVVERAVVAMRIRDAGQQRQQQREEAERFAAKVREQTAMPLVGKIVGVTERLGYDNTRHVIVAKPGKVLVEIGIVECTPEEARELLAALQPILLKKEGR